MFEQLTERMARKAELRAKQRTLELVAQMNAELPQGIEAEAAAEGVRLSGRNLRRRFVLEPALRWMRLS